MDHEEQKQEITRDELMAHVAVWAGIMEHIKAISRMAQNTLNSSDAKLNHQTLFSAFWLIEDLAGGKENELFTIAELFPDFPTEDFEE
jgi:hypothetical protein